MTVKLYIPADAAAVAVGADEVAAALKAAVKKHLHDLEIVRTGSRGLHWLEPLVEVATAKGRVGYGPVTVADVESVLAAVVAEGGDHKLRQGIVDEIPWLKRQTRLTFERCGIVDPRSLKDYRAHGGYKGLERALKIGSEATIEEDRKSVV